MQGLRLSDREDQLRRLGLTLRQAQADDEAMRRMALFGSMESALSFAYTWRATAGVKIGKIGEFVGKEGGLMLSASEKRAQARLILDVIASHTSRDQQALLDAEYGGENGERAAGIERLEHLFGGIVRSRSVIRLMLMREFVYGEKRCPGAQEIADHCGVSRSTAYNAAAKIGPAIAALRESTIEKLRPAFERRGYIPRKEEE
jgi:hypothetical protein